MNFFFVKLEVLVLELVSGTMSRCPGNFQLESRKQEIFKFSLLLIGLPTVRYLIHDRVSNPGMRDPEIPGSRSILQSQNHANPDS